MAKKKVSSDEYVDDSNPLAVGEETGDSDQVVDDVGYTIGSWKGLEQYKCNLCNYDSLNLKAIEVHIDKHRNSKTLIKPITQELPEGTEGEKGVFEVELEEVNSTVDENGNEVKNFIVKESE